MSDPKKLCPGCFAVESSGVCPSCGYAVDPEAFPTALRPGTFLVDRYLVGRVLGKPGGFGVTYLVYDTNLERALAMKELMPRDLLARRPDGSTLAPHTEDDREFFSYTLGAFLGEARTLAKFSHPNVVRIHDYFEANGTAYFTMEYYQGDPLSTYLNLQGGKISGDRALTMMLPVMDALTDIHDLGVLHRDIKPSNVYLTSKGTPILLDFGSARQALGERTRTLTTVLTPGYAPFEQYHEKGKQGPWTDVYGCAATLYAMVTGTPPLDAPSRMAGSDLVPPSRIAPVADTLSNAIVTGLSLQAEDRPPNIDQFRALLTGSPVVGGDTTHIWVSGAGNVTPSLGDPPVPTGPGFLGVAGPRAEGPRTERWEPGTAPPSVSTANPTVPPPPQTGRPTRKSKLPMAGILAIAGLLVASAFGLSQINNDKPGSALAGADTATAPALAVVESQAGEVAQELSAEKDPSLANKPEGEAADSVTPLVARTAAPPPAKPEPTPTTTSAPSPTVLVVVYGDGPSARQAETTLRRTLTRATGLDAVDPRGLEMARADRSAVQAALAGDFSALADLGRDFGAEYLLVGDLSATAVPSVGNFYTGSAELDVNVYRSSTGNVIDGEAFRVGSGSIPGKLGQNEMDARAQAVEAVSESAAEAAGRWVRRLR